jgi:hypothetical protein
MEQKQVPLVEMVKSFCVDLEQGYPAAFSILDALVRDHIKHLLSFRPEGVKIEKWEDKLFPEICNAVSRSYREHLVRVVVFS